MPEACAKSKANQAIRHPAAPLRAVIVERLTVGKKNVL